MRSREALSLLSFRHPSIGPLLGAFAITALVSLGGCATPDPTITGASRAQVIEKFGPPIAVYALPGGGERLEYQVGPYQQQAQMVDLGAEGRVIRVNQVRTAENFGRLKVGVDTPETMMREFGQPWLIQRYALSKLTAYMYPYRESNVWNLMMAVHFDDNGVLQRVESGPDPRFIGGRNQRD
jgi:hypothetical protein